MSIYCTVPPAELDEERIGKEVTLSLLRAGEIRDVRVTVGTRNGKEPE